MRSTVQSLRRHRKAKQSVAPEMQHTAEDFFDRIVPAMVAKNHLAFSRQRGSLCIWVYDVGTWTIQFGEQDLTQAVTRGACPSADLMAAFNKQTFGRFMAGEQIEPENGCFFRGDAKLLSRLGRVLEMPQGMLALRAANM